MRQGQLLSRILGAFLGVSLVASVVEANAQLVDRAPAVTSSSSQSSAGSDRLSFQPDLFTGRFNYSVPIAIPPGRQNSQPGISLNYSSGAGNGWCGVGWGLDLGHIQRDTTRGVPAKWDANGVVVNEYNETNGFVVSFGGVNSRLVNVGGNEYRAEIEGAFHRFTYQAPYWIVTDKNGARFVFGQTAAARMDNLKPGWQAGTGTFRWAIQSATDANGNTVNYEYTTIASNLYPLRVSYNGNGNAPALTAATNKVEFELETTNRLDKSISYQTGFRVETTRRLAKIRVFAGTTEVRRYDLAYTNSPSTQRSLLSSVTQFGADGTSKLPATTFQYQTKPFEFEPLISWTNLNSQGNTTEKWNSIRYRLSNEDEDGGKEGFPQLVDFFDMDGDAFPDRVMRQRTATNGNFELFFAQRNTGSNFNPSSQPWGPYIGRHPSAANFPWSSVSWGTALGWVGFIDLNGDGTPDRVEVDSPSTLNLTFTNYLYQQNTGIPSATGGFLDRANCGPILRDAATQGNEWGLLNYTHEWPSGNSAYIATASALLDINGDGLPDRVMSQNNYYAQTSGWFWVQLNLSNKFSQRIKWQFQIPEPGQVFYHPLEGGNSANDGGVVTGLYDINGDGLPDRVSAGTPFSVRLNNGSGFEAPEQWGPVEAEPTLQNSYPVFHYMSSPYLNVRWTENAALYDINGDGLLDRVIRDDTAGVGTNWFVQVNTGSGFLTKTNWGPIEKPTSAQSAALGFASTMTWGGLRTVAVFTDINGDGLPDRVMTENSPSDGGDTTKWDAFKVQLNKGPFPDLLNVISNGVGGRVEVAYVPSTKWNNRDKDYATDPWVDGAKSLLPFVVYTVSSVIADDGLGNRQANNYSYLGGMFDPARREFRGFNCVASVDPFGRTTRTYFHQGGGRNGDTNGEFLDAGSFAKKGIPYRTELYGNNGLLYKLTLNKVEEVPLAAGYCFPYISQTVEMDYEGLPNGAYRARAKRFIYDAQPNVLTSTGNLLREENLGQVDQVNFATHAVNTNGIYTHRFYTHNYYTNILMADGVTTIRSRPHTVKVTPDAMGATVTSLTRETRFGYDNRGNLVSKKAWFDDPAHWGTLLTAGYDQYGNLTNSIDATTVRTGTAHDTATRTFPVSKTTVPFTSYETHDAFGNLTYAKDIKGLVTTNFYDTHFRPIETRISTTSNGAPSLWKSKTMYNLGGIANGISQNYVLSQVNDATPGTNGHETLTYTDGLGRTIQTRAEAETIGYRVTDVFYGPNGTAVFSASPYFHAQWTHVPRTTAPGVPALGSYSEYDPIGRPFRIYASGTATLNAGRVVTPPAPAASDAGSTAGYTTIQYGEGAEPWAIVTTDPKGSINKSYRDAYGRTFKVTEILNSQPLHTWYYYDLYGNLTQVQDATGSWTQMVYDNMGRKIEMGDPDMGLWMYDYDDAGRMTYQYDPRDHGVSFEYVDPLGRMSRKMILTCNALGVWEAIDEVGYFYDSAGWAGLTVYPGQLSAVFDRTGSEYFSYDVRGRMLRSDRGFWDNTEIYQLLYNYNDADRLIDVTYPKFNTATNLAKVAYTYDTAGHVATVATVYGGGPATTLYNAATPGFDEYGRSKGVDWANTVKTRNTYHPNTRRLKNVQSYKTGAANFQDLTYEYDAVANLTKLTDAAFTTGDSSASLPTIQYDDLHRLTGYTRPGGATVSFSYSPVGNISNNLEMGAGTYLYAGFQPHAVTSANGKSYGYDAAGNMISRPGQTLTYDEENQLKQVNTLTFDYDYAGKRLRKKGPGVDTVWIEGLFERIGTRILCHVTVEGKRIASFTPDGAELYYYHTDHLGSTTAMTDRYGNLIKHYEYKAYGNDRYASNNVPPISARYTGQLKDDETGLYYYNSRYYDAELGRFIQPDTIVPSPGNPQTLNRYSYANNNPLGYSDPSGHVGEPSYNGPASRNPYWTPAQAMQMDADWDRWETLSRSMYDPSLRGGTGFTSYEASLDYFNSGAGWDLSNPAEVADYIGFQSRFTDMNPREGAAMPFSFWGWWHTEASEHVETALKVTAEVTVTAAMMTPWARLAGAAGRTAVAEGTGVAQTGGLNLFRYRSIQAETGSGWKLGDRFLYLPKQGSSKLNWIQNAGRLRQEMQKGQPIFDSYRDAITGNQIRSGHIPNPFGPGNIPTTGGRFLNAERYLLESRGWRYRPEAGAYYPPGF